MGEGAITRGEEAAVAQPSPPIGLAVAPPRSVRRQRFLVEKLAELGVDRLTWIITEHTEGRPPKADKARAWAIAALEQSGGAWLMDVDGPADIDELASEPGTLWVAERESFPPPSVVEGGIIVIGPEGGLDKGEAPETGIAFGLGKRVLRVETAAMTAATLFLDRCGRLLM